jgi:hypothetical protein
MALTQFLYDPFTEFDRLFDDAFTARFRPDSDESRPAIIRPKCVLPVQGRLSALIYLNTQDGPR